MAAANVETLDLPSGYKMPLLGLGTYQLTGSVHEVKVALEAAFDCGYRLIDAAAMYLNEALIGEALKELFESGKIKREELFVTSKVPNTCTGSREGIRSFFKKSLSDLKLDYIDLYLIHWPCGVKCSKPADFLDFMPREKSELVHHDYVQTWKAMEELVDEGLVRSIGLSNFNSKQIAAVEAAARIPISNLQVECHVYLTQVKLHQFCQQHGITLTSYSTLGAPGYGSTIDPKAPNLLKDPVVVEIARKRKRTPGQVLLRFMIQRKIAVIPKSSSPIGIKENSQIFDFQLTSEEMGELYGLDKNFRYFYDEWLHVFVEHPDYPFHEEF